MKSTVQAENIAEAEKIIRNKIKFVRIERENGGVDLLKKNIRYEVILQHDTKQHINRSNSRYAGP